MAAPILTFPDCEVPARKLAHELGVHCECIEVHRFPDGETRLRLPPEPAEELLLYRSLDHPNDKLVELLVAAGGLRELGVQQITLVAPYLCYMRQDMAFQAGEVVSQRIVGRLFAAHFDAVLTVDPHLHRIERLDEAIPLEHAIALSAAPAMGRELARHRPGPLLVGPDAESEQWVRAAAGVAGLDYVVGRKERSGDRNVSITLPPYEYAGRCAVLLDDMASTGRTLAVAARQLIDAGVTSVDVLVTHALFVGDALEVLRGAGVRRIESTDAVVHESNRFTLAPLLAEALR